MRRVFATALLLFALSLTLTLPSLARAESGKINLHLDLGVLVPPAGALGNVGFDWQFLPGYALDFQIGGGWLGLDVDTGFGFFQTALGVRFRFLDNKEGYLNDKGGDGAGNLYLVPRFGVMVNGVGGAFTFDATLGYEWSVARPMQIGVFLRPGIATGPLVHTPVAFYASAGLSFSFEFVKSPAKDSDHDRLSDEREIIKWKTNPNHPDTDGDGLWDGDEVYKHHTNPNDPDTDHGGSRDGWEVQNGRNPNDPSDDDLDHDRVPDERDACPGTPPNTEVDARGCAVLRRELVLEGIQFQFNSAVIQPPSEPTLLQAAQILRDNPGVRVEIGGHTDDTGNPGYNQRLSDSRARAVAEWLVQHGIAADRLDTRGYGAQKPRAPNDTEEHKAQNRRIEFRRL